LLGLWAAERMGMLGETAVDYALGLAATPAGKAHDDTALVTQVCEDMSARGYPIAKGDVRRQLAACASEARAEIPLVPES
ncbi:MAG: ATPase inhibitor subunit zeta, partial [Stellaceae bacterium]